MDALQQQVAIAAAVAWVIEKLKTYPWFTLMQVDTDKLNRRVSIGAAFLTSAGITWSYQGSFQEGGSFTVVIPSAQDLWAFASTFAGSMGLQELFYKGAVKPTPKTIEIESKRTVVMAPPSEVEIKDQKE